LGLEYGQDGWGGLFGLLAGCFFCGFCLGGLVGLCLVELVEEATPAAGFVGNAVLWFFVEGDGGDEAEVGVVDDLVDGGNFGFGGDVAGAAGVAGWLGARLAGSEGDGGDLHGVEEESSAAGVEVAEGDAEDDLVDGGLDGALVLDVREDEGGGAAGVVDGLGLQAVAVTVWGGAARGVVVVAEGFVLAAGARAGAEAGALAAVAADEDVAALLARVFGLDGGDVVAHVWGSPPACLCKVFKGRGLGGDFGFPGPFSSG